MLYMKSMLARLLNNVKEKTHNPNLLQNITFTVSNKTLTRWQKTPNWMVWKTHDFKPKNLTLSFFSLSAVSLILSCRISLCCWISLSLAGSLSRSVNGAQRTSWSLATKMKFWVEAGTPLHVRWSIAVWWGVYRFLFVGFAVWVSMVARIWVLAMVVEWLLTVWDFLMGFVFGFEYLFDLFGLGVVEWLADWRLGCSSVVTWMGRMVVLAVVGCWFPLIVEWKWLLDGLYGVEYHSRVVRWTGCGCWRSGDEKSDRWVDLAKRSNAFIILLCIVFFLMCQNHDWR